MRGAHLVSLGARGPSRALCGEEASVWGPQPCAPPAARARGQMRAPRRPAASHGRLPGGRPYVRSCFQHRELGGALRTRTPGPCHRAAARLPGGCVLGGARPQAWQCRRARTLPQAQSARPPETAAVVTPWEVRYAPPRPLLPASTGGGAWWACPPLGFPAWRLMKGPRSSPWPVASMLSPTGRLEGPSWAPFLSAGVWRRVPLGRAAKGLV